MEDLKKSIDSLIDELFADEMVEKSMIKDANPAKETADSASKQIPKTEKEKHPVEQISDVPSVDTDGQRDGQYDKDIVEKQEDGKVKEQDQVQPPKDMKKSLSDEEYAEYQELKKAKAAKVQEETLMKARKEQADLIKSAVVEATSEIRKENEELKKSMIEQAELIKAMANRPRQPKAVTSVQALEKFQKSESSHLSKSELLDIAEELVKSGKLGMESVIELENTGYIYEQEPRRTLEREILKRNK